MSWKIIDDIKKPLITKKTSTPKNPPLNESNWKWKKITARTDIALKESISGL